SRNPSRPASITEVRCGNRRGLTSKYGIKTAHRTSRTAKGEKNKSAEESHCRSRIRKFTQIPTGRQSAGMDTSEAHSKCLLGVTSRHTERARSASALPPKADIFGDQRFGPLSARSGLM